MKIKKLMALGLALVMTASVLAGCGNSGSESKSSSASSSQAASSQTSSAASSAASESSSSAAESTVEDKGITFPLAESVKYTALMLQHKAEAPVKDNAAWNALLEYGNIEVELQELEAAEASEKANLILAGGNYPDFLYKLSSLDAEKYGMDGIFIPLEDLIKEYMPNLTARLDAVNGWASITAADGHIYGLPTIQMGYYVGTGESTYWINQKWMDTLGLETPTDMESLYEVLKAFKEKDPNGNGVADEIPFSFYSTGYRLFFEYAGGMTYYDPVDFAIKDGELVYSPYTDQFKEVLGWLAKMYKEGIIEEDCFVQTAAQAKAQGVEDNCYGMYLSGGPHTYTSGDYAFDYRPFIPFEPELMARSAGVSENGLMITDKCENPEILCAWMDYAYSDEGGNMIWMGPEGVGYEVGENGYYKWTYQDKDLISADFRMSGSSNVPCYVNPYVYSGLDPELVNSNRSYWNYQKWDASSKYGVWHLGGVVLPTLVYTEDETTTVNDLSTDIKGYIRNYIAQVVVGELELESSWDTFQSTLKNMGADELFNLAKTAYERATAN